ncbi:hypothetical protein [Beggiatoa leptomitoformis]|uniref:Uncharacterized protein n=1 Tax=Beggiatoa leptomitoformis TaxID=288004 RepID=A0A2N9YHF5_9GAMM|nr:hypothetical protein [Beggiatoa leptomitoformis]ALG67914.2 hypothetical protein AL038_09570 [Beggiatoa leptomitoformis]AUI69815.2 hypothetical protein BLE401_14700 [Beggiatoa leptomitoformis]
MIAFEQHYKGRFSGILRWTQLDALWEKVQASPEGWYVYFVGGAVPQQPTNALNLQLFIDELDSLLRHEHDYDFCGLIYADNVENPAMIKVFDPHQLGSGCGVNHKPVFPRWLLSKIPPESLLDNTRPTANRHRWWKQLFFK